MAGAELCLLGRATPNDGRLVQPGCPCILLACGVEHPVLNMPGAELYLLVPAKPNEVLPRAPWCHTLLLRPSPPWHVRRSVFALPPSTQYLARSERVGWEHADGVIELRSLKFFVFASSPLPAGEGRPRETEQGEASVPGVSRSPRQRFN